MAKAQDKPKDTIKEVTTEPKIGSKNKNGAIYVGKGMWVKK